MKGEGRGKASALLHRICEGCCRRPCREALQRRVLLGGGGLQSSAAEMCNREALQRSATERDAEDYCIGSMQS
jgi:hypothetical protein